MINHGNESKMDNSQLTIEAGYKQTEVGVIPEDWQVIDLSNLCSLQRGFDITEATRVAGDVPVYSSSGISYFHNQALVSPPGVVTGRKGILGKVFYIEKPFWPHDTTLWVKDFKGNHPAYVALVLKNFHLERLDAATSVPTLNRNNLVGYLIPHPPNKAEQQAIAEVLSDVDALIASLNQLITKKRNVKQGVMQVLLTGQKRLTGFKDDWETNKLGEIGEVSGAGVDKKIKLSEVPVRLVNYLDVYKRDFIYSKHLNHKVTAPATKALNCAVKKGDVFFTPSSEVRYDVGLSAVAMEDIPDAAYSYHVVRLRLKEAWDLAFRTYIFKTRYFLSQAEVNCEGSGKRYVISLKKFRELSVFYPKLIEEQKAIAQILSDMDAEIELLEEKRDKYKAIKQGMMQELLTGKTRLV